MLPDSYWQESGRYDSVGSELLRFTDRNGFPMVLGMTHEGGRRCAGKEYGATYSRYPFLFTRSRPNSGMKHGPGPD